MRAKRKRSAEHLETDRQSEGRRSRRRQKPAKSGIPKLGLWECGIGAGWK